MSTKPRRKPSHDRQFASSGAPSAPLRVNARVTAASPCVLAIDASSTTIGWVVLDEGCIRDRDTFFLTGSDIADRCRQAFAQLGAILMCHPDIELVALEGPVARYARALIPQSRVAGALLTAAALRGILTLEVAPAAAKRRLTGRGTADKAAMCAASGIADEHQADAYAIALYAADCARRIR